jgi:hypothetical protein
VSDLLANDVHTPHMATAAPGEDIVNASRRKTRSSGVKVVRADEADATRITTILSAGFQADPVSRWLFPDDAVRHEAPSDRAEVKGLRRLAVAAAGLKPRAA